MKILSVAGGGGGWKFFSKSKLLPYYYFFALWRRWKMTSTGGKPVEVDVFQGNLWGWRRRCMFFRAAGEGGGGS